MEGTDVKKSRRRLTRKLQHMVHGCNITIVIIMIFQIPLRNGRVTSMRTFLTVLRMIALLGKMRSRKRRQHPEIKRDKNTTRIQICMSD